MCCSSWGRKGSDMTERLNRTELRISAQEAGGLPTQQMASIGSGVLDAAGALRPPPDPHPPPDSGDMGPPQHFAEEAYFESSTLGTDNNQIWKEGAGRLKVTVRRGGWRDAQNLVKKPGSQGQAQPLPLTQDLELVVGVPRSPACSLFHTGREQRAVAALRPWCLC